MILRFTKMQGLGNDFVVFDGVRQRVDLSPAQIRALADRHFGVGCDQVLVVERARGDADFRYRIFNASGEEVEHCGNGARCFVVFVRDQGLSDKYQMRVETKNGLLVLRQESDGQVTVDMGAPRLNARDVPFEGGTGEPVEPLDVDGTTVEVSVLSMGNPHAVQRVADVDAAPVATQGPRIERHPRFPQRVNAGYMEVVDRATIRLRVWERGVGETLACGTGACAAVVAAVRRGDVDSPVRVIMHGGELVVRWNGDATPVTMTGPAVSVFEGRWDSSAAPACNS
ncbi:MAG: diaminopimelate epimerase [Burkholderiales bacterium]|nr:diaminopimelate epimerase [Burkholderiales bacterium]